MQAPVALKAVWDAHNIVYIIFIICIMFLVLTGSCLAGSGEILPNGGTTGDACSSW